MDWEDLVSFKVKERGNELLKGQNYDTIKGALFHMCSGQKASSSTHIGLAQYSHLQKPFSPLTECLQNLSVPLILACHYIMEFIHFLKIGFKYLHLYLIYKLFDNKHHVSCILHLF